MNDVITITRKAFSHIKDPALDQLLHEFIVEMERIVDEQDLDFCNPQAHSQWIKATSTYPQVNKTETGVYATGLFTLYAILKHETIDIPKLTWSQVKTVRDEFMKAANELQ